MRAASTEWKKLEFTVDQGATEMNRSAAVSTAVSTTPRKELARGVIFTCASAEQLPNLGEKKCAMVTNDFKAEHRLSLRVAGVNRALLAASQCISG